MPNIAFNLALYQNILADFDQTIPLPEDAFNRGPAFLGG